MPAPLLPARVKAEGSRQAQRVSRWPRVLSRSRGYFFFQAEDGIRDHCVTGVQTCALPIYVCAQQNGSGNGRPGRGQQQAVRVVSVSGGGPYTVGISPGTRMPNVRSSQSPQEIGRASCRERV